TRICPFWSAYEHDEATRDIRRIDSRQPAGSGAVETVHTAATPLVGFSESRQAGCSDAQRKGLGEERYRRFCPRQARGEKSQTFAAGRQIDADSPGHAPSDRT